jgi:thiamine pyrophosphokinase
MGLAPIVVGDFDSFASLPHASHLRQVQSIDQATTDCDKMLALAREDGHGAITLTATEGDLPDHVLATYSSAVASGLDVRFAFRRGTGQLVRDTVRVEARAGQRVSLVPLTACLGVGLSGVAWTVENGRFEPGNALSVSNEALGGPVVATLESGVALLFLESREVAW